MGAAMRGGISCQTALATTAGQLAPASDTAIQRAPLRRTTPGAIPRVLCLVRGAMGIMAIIIPILKSIREARSALLSATRMPDSKPNATLVSKQKSAIANISSLEWMPGTRREGPDKPTR